MSTISKYLAQPPDNFSTQISSSTVGTTDLSVSLDSTSGLPTEGVGQFFKKDAQGNLVSGSVEFVHWTNVSGNTITFSDVNDRGITGSDSGAQAYVADDYFEVWSSSYYTAGYGGLTEHTSDGTHGDITPTSIDTPALQLSTSSVTADDILDEDTMSSDSATALATQQSIKAYVDTAVAGGSGGKVLQVVVGVSSTEANENAGTWTDSNLTASITPASTSNKVLAIVNHGENSVSANGVYMGIRLVRGATPDVIRTIGYLGSATGGIFNFNANITYLDSPASASEITYKTQFAKTAGTGTVAVQKNSSPSTIILMEIEG